MATETENSPPLSVQMVGNAFVNQYYGFLHQSPELVYKFYQDSSVLSRPDSDGQMTTVTTIKGINDKILSMGYKNYKAEISTADAQDSHEKGVIVLVTGSLTGKDRLRRRFIQSFFLAPQEKGYFVLNDVFRYVEDSEPLDAGNEPVDKTEDSSVIPIEHAEPANIPDPSVNQATSQEDKNFTVAEQSSVPAGNEVHLINEKEIVVEDHPSSNENNLSAIGEPSSSVQDEGPKKSYASILMKSSGGLTRVYVPTNTAKATSANVHKLLVVSASTAQVTEASTTGTGSVSVPKGSNTKEEAEGHSIYIRNLPLNMTPAQLEEEFKKYGPIKQGGIQVRNNKQNGSCFGFVEFQLLSSRNSAIKDSPISIGNYQVVVEEKRTTTRVGKARFPSGRGGFRSDNYRGQGNYSAGWGFGRNEYGGRGDFLGRGRGARGHGRGSYQERRGKSAYQSGLNQTARST